VFRGLRMVPVLSDMGRVHGAVASNCSFAEPCLDGKPTSLDQARPAFGCDDVAPQLQRCFLAHNELLSSHGLFLFAKAVCIAANDARVNSRRFLPLCCSSFMPTVAEFRLGKHGRRNSDRDHRRRFPRQRRVCHKGHPFADCRQGCQVHAVR